MSVNASGMVLPFTEEDFNKTPEELMGAERIERLTKEHGEIMGFTKVKSYDCEQWANECRCGYDDIDKDEDRQYCPSCGEQLFYEHDYDEKTPYKGCLTAKSIEDAMEKFTDDNGYDDGIKYDEPTCKERIRVWAWFTKVPELGDGYQPKEK